MARRNAQHIACQVARNAAPCNVSKLPSMQIAYYARKSLACLGAPSSCKAMNVSLLIIYTKSPLASHVNLTETTPGRWTCPPGRSPGTKQHVTTLRMTNLCVQMMMCAVLSLSTNIDEIHIQYTYTYFATGCMACRNVHHIACQVARNAAPSNVSKLPSLQIA